MVAPSDMMDGRVGAIREALDEAGFAETPIMAYSAKYASGFYGPFREAADSTPQFGDRRCLPDGSGERRRGDARDRARPRRGRRHRDGQAGAALPRHHLARSSASSACPLAAYSVSRRVRDDPAAAQLGWIDEQRAIMEALIGIRRAGADIIITYFAKDAARLLERGLHQR